MSDVAKQEPKQEPEETKAQYKLTIIRKWGDRGTPQEEYQICVIGYFGDEEKLAEWARENNGELEKC